MKPRAPLTDDEAHAALVAAGDILRGLTGLTVRADTTLEAARMMLATLTLALVAAMEDADGPNPALSLPQAEE